MKKILILMLTLNISCASLEQQEREYVYDARMSAIKEAEVMLVAEDCEKPILRNRHTGTNIRAKACGLLYDSLFVNNQLKKEICPALDLRGKKCDQQVKDTYLARVADRYKYATDDQLQRQCTLDPLKCKGLRDAEIILINLHNEAIMNAFAIHMKAEKEKAAGIRSAAEENRSAGISSALGSLSNGFQNTSQQQNPSSYKPPSHYCSGVKPVSQYNCRVSCINGTWSQVCN